MQETLGNRATFQLDEKALNELRASVRGAILTPRDPCYDEARRVWNGMIDKRPSVIVRPHSTVDVMTSVRFAGDRGLEVSVRGGGHNIAGTSVAEGGLMIDMSSRRSVRVDPANRVVLVEGGATWGDVDHENSRLRTRGAERHRLHDRGRRLNAWKRLRMDFPQVRLRRR